MNVHVDVTALIRYLFMCVLERSMYFMIGAFFSVNGETIISEVFQGLCIGQVENTIGFYACRSISILCLSKLHDFHWPVPVDVNVSRKYGTLQVF